MEAPRCHKLPCPVHSFAHDHHHLAAAPSRGTKPTATPSTLAGVALRAGGAGEGSRSPLGVTLPQHRALPAAAEPERAVGAPLSVVLDLRRPPATAARYWHGPPGGRGSASQRSDASLLDSFCYSFFPPPLSHTHTFCCCYCCLISFPPRTAAAAFLPSLSQSGALRAWTNSSEISCTFPLCKEHLIKLYTFWL